MAITINDPNYVVGDYYTIYAYAVYDYSTTPSLVYTYTYPTPSILYYPTTPNLSINYQVSKDVTAQIYQVKVVVYKNGSHPKIGASFYLNSDDYYTPNIPITIYE